MKTQPLITALRAPAVALAVMAATCLVSSAQQLIVTPQVLSASSWFGPRPPQRLVDGSGLTAGPSGILGAADSTHSNDAGQMWYSNPGVDFTPWVIFDLGAVYDLQTTRLWQYNEPGGATVYGAEEVEVSVAEVDTNSFTALSPTLFPNRAGGTNGEPAQDFATPSTLVRFIKVQIWLTFGGAASSGLSEVRFLVDSNTAPPVITGQPQNQTVAAGATATFTVAAVGPPPISYQWRHAGTNLSDGAGISGATTNTLVVSSATLASEGDYDVVLTNPKGPTTSAKATLAIGSPVITQQPANWVGILGQNASFIVIATDFGGNASGLTFQWRRNGTNLVEGLKFSGVTTTNLVVSNTDASDNGGYSVQITDTLGKVTISRTASLTAAPSPAVSLSVVNQPIVAPSGATATSYFGPRPPGRLIDGSGLTAGPSGILGAADSTHSNDAGQMWFSDPFLTVPDVLPTVTFDLGGVYDLQKTRIWNYNEPGGGSGFGAKEVEVAVSTDNVNFNVIGTNTVARAGETNFEPAQDFDTPVTGVRYVRLHIVLTWAGIQVSGFSEVRFVAAGSKVSVTLNNGVLGLHYRFEYRNSLGSGSWQVLKDIPSLGANPFAVSDPSPMQSQTERYYRALLVP